MYRLIICWDAQNTKRENSIVDMKFENIKKLRKANEKNQQELADYYKVSVDYLLGRNNQHC